MGCTSQETTEEPDIDAVFRTLAKQRRRYVLSCLKEHGMPIALADLATEIAARENGSLTPERPTETGNEVTRIYTSLYHIHIPKLVDANLVEHDHNQQTVALTESAEHLEPLFDGSNGV